MSSKDINSIAGSAAVLLAFGAAYAILVVTARKLPDAFDQMVVTNTAGVLFGSALTVFLIRVFMIIKKPE